MRRTNIYLDDDKWDVLRHLAIAEGRSSSELIRQAVDDFLAVRLSRRDIWGHRLDQLVARVRDNIPANITPEEIEADITAASDEVGSRGRARRH